MRHRFFVAARALRDKFRVMKNFKRIALIVTTVLGFQLSLPTQAATPPQLQNLSLPQVDSVFEVFGADLIFRPLEPASSHVDIFGLSFGVVAGVTSTKKVKDQISAVTINQIPAGDIYVGLHGPFGLALELGFIPALDVKDITLEQYGGDLKWTINKVFFGDILPFDIALRGMYAGARVTYKQTISGIADVIGYNTTLYGFNLSVSKQFLFIEPYVGLGWVGQEAKLSNTGTLQLFNTAVSLTNTLEKNLSSVWFYGGAQIHLFFANITAEYSNTFGVPTYAGKLGFKF